MFTTQELLARYETYTDDQLIQLHSELHNYSDEAKEAFNTVIVKKGGLDNLLRLKKEKERVAIEENRIAIEAEQMARGGSDASFAKTMITSELLTSGEVEDIIEKKFQQFHKQKEDVKIKPRTIIGGVIGCILASLTGGTLWGTKMIYTRSTALFMFAGLAMLCYAIVWICTRQSYKNAAVLIATVISFVLSLGLGQILFVIFGYRGGTNF